MPACDSNLKPELTVVVPIYNEGKGITAFHERTSKVLRDLGSPYEILYVNDGSRDNSLEMLLELCNSANNVSLINLSRNFGKEIALTAGLDYARGDAVVLIDADLQDPPELIPELLAKWREGYDDVYAQRLSRSGETWLKKVTAHCFYRLFNAVSGTSIPVDTGDYRLLSRRAVNSICRLREQHRFMKGLYGWVGFRRVAVPYHRHPRAAGHSKWSYWRLWNLSVEGITSFSTLPLRLMMYFGAMISFFAIVYGIFMVLYTFIEGSAVPGYPSIVVFILFASGLQLFALGVIGEYIGRIFDEVKDRPLYLVESTRNVSIGGG